MDQKLESVLQIARRTGPLSETTPDTASGSSREQLVSVGELVERIWNQDWQLDREGAIGDSASSISMLRLIESLLMNWLRYEVMQHREAAIKNAFWTTYEWIHDSSRSRLPAWLSSMGSRDGNEIFWITGKPGSGKSTMMKYIVRHTETQRLLEAWAGEVAPIVTSFYAWKPGATLGKSVEGLIRSILYQVLGRYPDWAPEVCPRRWTLLYLTIMHDYPLSSPAWPDWELIESLKRLLSLVHSKLKLTIFIDGLDEFGDDSGPEDNLDQLLEIIRILAAHQDVKVCVASRPWRQFSDAFASCPRLRMQDATCKDMTIFVRGHFESEQAFKDFRLKDDDVEDFFNEIVNRSEGMFLWLVLVTKTIREDMRNGHTIRELRRLLELMPTEIEDLFRRIYNTLPERIRLHTAAMLRTFMATVGNKNWHLLWLAEELRSSNEDDKPADVDHEDAKTNMRRKLISRTRGLLEIVGGHLMGDSGDVECLHRTAMEWLQQPETVLQLERDSPTSFDPNKHLFEAAFWEGHGMTSFSHYTGSSSFSSHGNWPHQLFYASRMDYRITDPDLFFRKMDLVFRAGEWPFQQQQTFVMLCVTFVYLHYVRYKLDGAKGQSIVAAWSSTVPNLLAHAILGLGRAEGFGKPRYFESETDLSEFEPLLHFDDKRLEQVKYLLTKGFKLQPIHVQVLDHAAKHGARWRQSPNREYLERVLELLRTHNGKPNRVRRLISTARGHLAPG